MDSFSRFLWICGVFACMLTGCATSSRPVEVSYEASSNRTTYETKKMPLEDMRVIEGLERDLRFYVKVSGTCTGEDCVPRTYTVSFIKEGTQSVQIQGRGVRLKVGTETITWEDPQSREVDRTTSIRSGTFAQIDLTSKQLTTVGSVRSVTGTIGGVNFSLPHGTRAPIRQLLSRLGKTANASSGQSSL